mgnify:CR=1 FL=1
MCGFVQSAGRGAVILASSHQGLVTDGLIYSLEHRGGMVLNTDRHQMEANKFVYVLIMVTVRKLFSHHKLNITERREFSNHKQHEVYNSSHDKSLDLMVSGE